MNDGRAFIFKVQDEFESNPLRQHQNFLTTAVLWNYGTVGATALLINPNNAVQRGKPAELSQSRHFL